MSTQNESKTVKGKKKIEPGSIANGWSIAEKEMCKQLYKEAPELEYPLVLKRTASGAKERMYIIPESKAEAVVRALWPFANAPASDALLADLHSAKTLYMRDCRVARCMNRNVVVSPHYLETGGMVVDLVSAVALQNGDTAFAALLAPDAVDGTAVAVTGIMPKPQEADK